MNLSPAQARLAASPANAAIRQAQRYSSDAFSYSLPGGFVKQVGVAASPAVDTAPRSAARSSASNVASDPIGEHDHEHTLVVTDAACDLPLDWLNAHGVLVLPIRIRFDSRSRADTGNVAQAIDFFRRDLPRLGRDAQALALSAAGTQDFVEPHLADHIDYVLEIAQASSRGSGYMNSLVAAQNLMLQHGRSRRQHGATRPFKMWVIDAATAWSGEGVLVAETVRALQQGLSVPRVVQHVDALRKCVHTLAVPGDVGHWHRHNRGEQEAVMGWLSLGVEKMLDRTPVLAVSGNTPGTVGKMKDHDAALSRAFEMAVAEVADVSAPVMCLSFAGELAAIRQRPDFAALAEACKRHGVTLHVATMSLTNALSLGGGGLSIAFASERFAP